MNNHRIAVIVSEFNPEITDKLYKETMNGLAQHGIPEGKIDVVRVPGAFELPIAANILFKNKNYAGAICLGCVIQGETPHFDYVCEQAARGIMDVALRHEKPIIFGVLTTLTHQQARQRCGLEEPLVGSEEKKVVENKGAEAAKALVQMLKLLP